MLKKIALLFFLSLFCLTSGLLSLRAATEFPLESLQRCTVQLSQFDDWFRNLIPLRLVQLDRRLYRFVQGVRFHRENLKLLEEVWPTVSEKTHVAGNATDGCEAYYTRYRRRAYYFMAFGTCLAVVGSLLTGLAFLNTFLPGKKPRRNRDKENPNPQNPVPSAPSDR